MPKTTLPYELWSRSKLHLLWVREVALLPRFSGIVLHPNTYCAWKLRTGEATVRIKDNKLRAWPGEWMILPPCARYQHFSKGSTWLSISFKIRWQGGEPLWDIKDGAVIPDAGHPGLQAKTADLIEATRVFNQPHLIYLEVDFSAFLSIHARFLDWLHELFLSNQREGEVSRPCGPTDTRIEEMVQLLEGWPVEQKYDAAKLAARLRLSTSQIDRLFQEHLRMTPRRFLNHRRLDRARYLLSRKDLEIKQVAYECGFQGPAQFSIWFRKHQRTSPSDYRREYDHWAGQ